MQKKLALAAAVIHGPKVLFLDEPFEGVDAVASNTLKAMLQSMIARGATIFLTSHVLEIVERLCSHVAIIHRGQLVAQGSLEELRAGVDAQALPLCSASGAAPGDQPAPGEKLTLEQIFLRIVGGTRRADQELSWLELEFQSRTCANSLPPSRRVRWQLFVNSLRTVRGRLELVARIFMFLGFGYAGSGRQRRPRLGLLVFRCLTANLNSWRCYFGPYFCSGNFFPCWPAPFPKISIRPTCCVSR